MDEVFIARIRVPDSDDFKDFRGEFEVVKVAPTRLEIRETAPFIELFTFGDTIEVEPHENEFLFKEVVGRSRYRTFEFLLSEKVAESTQLQQFVDQLVERGGHWERLMSGWLLIHLPEDSDYDPSNDISRVVNDVG